MDAHPKVVKLGLAEAYRLATDKADFLARVEALWESWHAEETTEPAQPAA